MNGTRAPAARSEAVERYLSRIETHLVRLAEGHDPLGHLFGIERLARGARAEWWEAQRQTQPGRHGR
ncbi:MAG: hypothetical protein ACYDCI_03165 [Candidatus Limnocylindrales bacterium]